MVRTLPNIINTDFLNEDHDKIEHMYRKLGIEIVPTKNKYYEKLLKQNASIEDLQK